MRPAHSLCLIALLVLALLPGAAAQSLETPAVDPQTGEHVPFGFEAPPAESFGAARGGGDLVPVQYLPSGSTKLVRNLPSIGSGILFQDGGSLVTVALDGTAEPPEMYPLELDRFVLNAQPSDAVVRGDLVFVALRKQEGLLILDLSDPSAIVEVGRAEGRDLLSMAVAGDYAYAGQGTSGIVVYDISDPADPVEVATQPSAGSSNGTFVDGSTLYVAGGTSGLRTFDITDPTDPAAIGSLGTNDQFCTYVTVRDGVAWLTGAFGLIAADVSDPANPVEIGSIGTGNETAFEVAFDGTTAFMPGNDGLRTLDVSDPADIQQLALVPGNQAFSVTTSDGAVLFTERFKGLSLVEGTPEAPEVEQVYDNAGFAHKATFAGDLFYVTDLAGRLRIIDTSGDEAVEIGRVDVPPNTQYVNVVGDFAYVADADFGGTGLTIVDVSTPTAPVTVGGFFSANQAFGLDVVADGDVVTVYLANGFSGLVVLDASDPANVTELGGFPIGANVVDVEVRDDVAYVVSFGGGMLTLDVSDPANLTQLDAEPSWGFLNAIDLEPEDFGDKYALVADGGNGQNGIVRVVDISDPTDIITTGTEQTASQARDIATTEGFYGDVNGPVVYVADDFFGLRQFDGPFSGTVFETGSFESGDRGIGVATQAPLLFPTLVALAAGEAGVYIFEAPFFTDAEDGTTAEAFALQSAFPNPFRDATTVRFTLPEASDVTLTVYDVLGRRVATLEDGPLAAGDHEATFDADGLPSGVYLIRLDAGSRHATQHVMHIR